jgi:GTP cyclohydrolase II
MAPPDAQRINGDPNALTFDRALSELRRGRAIQLVDGGRSLCVAAIETLQAPLHARMRAAAGEELTVFVTAERAHAAQLVPQFGGPVAIPCPATAGVEELQALAGVGTAPTTTHAPVRAAPAPAANVVAAALQLAKAARLVPALLGFDVASQALPGVLSISVQDAERYTRFGHRSLKLISRARVPLADALDCEIALFRDEHSLAEHVAVLIGKPDQQDVVPVRLHSACLTGDLLGSLRCDCGEQLRTAVARIAALGGGVLLYLDQEGRGIGLPNKLRAYVLQDAGLDTVDADRHLGFLADERSYDVAAALLHELKISRIKLLTNNPQKINSLRDHGIDVVGRLPLVTSANTHNERYLRAKLERAGHLADG